MPRHRASGQGTRRSAGRDERSPAACTTPVSHQNVVLHGLTQRRDRRIGGQGSRREFLSLKGARWSDRNRYPLKADEYQAI